MKSFTLPSIALAASVVTAGVHAGASTDAVKATVTGRVLFDGPLPVGPAAGGGKVEFDGTKPDMKPLQIDAEKSEGCTHGDSPMDSTDRSLMIDASGGIANVVVLFDVDGAEAKPAASPLQLDQTSCRFEPHVVVVTAGTTVEFLNSDGVSHNVHTYPGKNDPMNKIIAAGSKETQKLDKADRIEIKCDIHPWMNSWLIVTDAPFFAVTDTKGEFAIEGLSAGTHKVEYWHEKLGKNKGEITVAADGTADLKLEWGMEEKKSGGRGRRR